MNHEWLSETIFYAVFSVGGLPLLTLLAVTLATLTVGVTWSLMRGPTLLRLALTGITLGSVSIAWTPRPHVFTLFLVSVTAKLMVTGRHRWLPLVFVLWANLHGGFTLGVGLLGAFGLSGLPGGVRQLAARTGLITVCLLATLLTPLGLTFWEELPASLARLQAYEVQEWQGPTLTNVSVLPFWVVLGTLGWLLYQRGRSLFDDPADRLLMVASLLFVPLALTSLRNVPPFLVFALPAVTRGLRIEDQLPAPTPEPRQALVHGGFLAGTIVVAVGVVGAAWSGPLPRLGWTPLSPEVVRAIDACEGPLYNSYDDGGYLVWFMPDRKVFLDSRQDPYPVELIQQDIRAQLETDYRDTFAQHGVRCALVRSGVPLDRRLQADGWQTLHRDARWTVLEGEP